MTLKFLPRRAPTDEAYAELQQAYNHFNEALFDGILPQCLITLQREKRTCGYFSPERFISLDGRTTDEIALNPALFAAVPIIETMQTLCHEMAHLWQHHYGTPGRGRYHNEEWAAKMESIGLMPSSTGQKGGKRTGDRMADYAIETGLFLEVCQQLLTADFQISWYDRFPDWDHVMGGQGSMANQLVHLAGSRPPFEVVPELAEGVKPIGSGPPEGGGERTATVNRSNRLKYSCEGCTEKNSVWGRPGLRLICGECAKNFVAC